METDAKEVKAFVRENLRATLTVKEIAAKWKKHPSDFGRDFRNCEGTTLHRYIERLLGEKALQMIADENCRGYEVRKALGFPSDRQFYRWMKRVFRVPFRELRASLQKHDYSSSVVPRSQSGTTSVIDIAPEIVTKSKHQRMSP